MSILFCTFATETKNGRAPGQRLNNEMKYTEEETRKAWRELGDAWLEALEELNKKHEDFE